MLQWSPLQRQIMFSPSERSETAIVARIIVTAYLAITTAMEDLSAPQYGTD